MTLSQTYISDIISTEEIESWKPSDRILISAPTGKGKTQFVCSTLYQYAQLKGRKILILENRVILRDQIIEDLEEGYQNVITIKLYQNLESKIVKNSYDYENIFDGFDYVFIDEAHYFAGDAVFNQRTDLVLNAIIRDHPNLILIFASATPYSLTESEGIIRYTKEPYVVQPDFTFIEKLYFYNKEGTPEQILRNTPEGEKVIYFGSAQSAYDLYNKFSDSAFICARNNVLFNINGNRKDIEKFTEDIVINQMFEQRFLFTTRVLDNGISIKDENVRRIIIDDSLDLVTLVQMIGRKRIENMEFDKVTLYIKNHQKYAIQGKVNILSSELSKVKEQLEKGIETFLRDNKKRDLPDVFDTDAQINNARHISKQFQLNKYKIMLEKPQGFKEVVCNILEYDLDLIKSADNEFQKLTATEVIEKYKNKKLFKTEQVEFRDAFLEAILEPKKEKLLGIHTIQGILQDWDFPYSIARKQIRKGGSRGQRYWIILDDVGEENGTGIAKDLYTS